MTSGISRDEWLRAMQDAAIVTEDDPSAITVQEFAEMFKLGRFVAARKLAALEQSGKATRTHKRQLSPNGKMIEYVAYRLMPKTGKNKPKSGRA